MEWILGVEPWSEILDLNRKLNSGDEICVGVWEGGGVQQMHKPYKLE